LDIFHAEFHNTETDEGTLQPGVILVRHDES
jgi:hypothetical protein